MARTVPDRVPVMCQMSIGHMLLQTGARPSEFWHSAETYADGLVTLRRLYGFDGILVSLYGHAPDWAHGIARLERTAEGERIVWSNGDVTDYPFDDLPVPRPSAPPRRPGFSTFDPEAIPDRIVDIPVSQGLKFPLDEGHLFDALKLVRDRTGEDISLHGEVTSPLDYVLALFGFEEAMIGFVEDPGRARAILERFTEGLVRLAEGLTAAGVDAIKISSPFAGAGFLSASFYRTFVLPYEGRIAHVVEDHGVRCYLHTCGDVSDRLELMAESGASGIECLDPPPLGRVELAEAKRRVGGRIFLKGNIDPIHVLLHASRDRVRADALKKIEEGKPGGGYILSTACSIAPRTPRDNVLVLREAVEQAGRY